MKILKIIITIVIALFLVIIFLPYLHSPDNLAYDKAVREKAPGKFITVKGNKVHYIEKGKGRAIICIHGFFYNTVMWEKNINALSEKYRVLAIDLWGWGYSERLNKTQYSFKTYADQIVGFMDALKIDKASLIGQSMGGGISVYAAAHYPDRFDRLILIDPAVIPYQTSITANLYKLPRVGEFFNALPGDFLLENNVRTLWFYNGKALKKDYIDKVIHPLRINGTIDGGMYILRHVLKPPYVEKEARILADMNKSILIIHGREDNEVPLKSSETLHTLWKASRLEIFEKAKHSPHEEYPDKFNKLALDFLNPSSST